jgi:hypothetical protein
MNKFDGTHPSPLPSPLRPANFSDSEFEAWYDRHFKAFGIPRLIARKAFHQLEELRNQSEDPPEYEKDVRG